MLKKIKTFFTGYWNIMRHGERRDKVIAWVAVILSVIFIGYIASNTLSPYAVKSITAAEFVAQMESGNVKSISVCAEDGSVTGTLNQPTSAGVVNFSTTVPNASETFTQVYLSSSGVDYDFAKPSKFASFLASVFMIVFQVGLIVIAIGLLFKSTGGVDLPFFGDDDELDMEIPDADFSEVLGLPEAIEEMQEIVTFLKNPELYVEAGAKFPRGVLMQGPPGCGKTLLARCLAGEAGVPFIHASGSEFIEMYVGVGARRIRKLFKQAREHQPAILFIDEIDAVGGSRDTRVQTTDEHLQTLNQLLTEMDGFDNKDTVIVIAATNRGDSLDSALLRPGRFDRIITVDNPAKEGRMEILQYYAQGRPFAESVNFERLASHTYGFSGAQLESVINQAATLAARRAVTADGDPLITEEDLEEGISRVISGPAMKSKKLSDKEKEMTAYHEAGHAVVQYLLPGCDPVQKISIVSRNMPGVGMALGYVQSYAEEDSYVMTSAEMRDEIASLLAGRCSEQMYCNVETAGASNDLERASKLAYQMVDRFAFDVEGFNSSFRVEVRDSKSLMLQVGQRRLDSIDEQVETLLNEAWETASKIVCENKDKIEKIVETLKRQETIDSDEIKVIMEQ